MTSNQRSSDKYIRPESLEETLQLLANSPTGAKVIAGGQSLMLFMRQGLLDPSQLIDITGVGRLAGIEINDGTVTIGATTSYQQIESRLDEQFGAVLDAVKVIADRQVRNLGTIGGAVARADPALDILAPLYCLGASVTVRDIERRRVIPIDEFIQGYMDTALRDGELLQTISFDVPSSEEGSAYVKHAKIAGGWATVGTASSVSINGDRVESLQVALSAVGDTIVRATSVEDALIGAVGSPENVGDAVENLGEDIDPIEDISGSASYKRSVAKNLTQRCIQTALSRAVGTT